MKYTTKQVEALVRIPGSGLTWKLAKECPAEIGRAFARLRGDKIYVTLPKKEIPGELKTKEGRRAMLNSLKENPMKTTTIPCFRCQGSGLMPYAYANGKCFRCGGSGVDPTTNKPVVKPVIKAKNAFVADWQEVNKALSTREFDCADCERDVTGLGCRVHTKQAARLDQTIESRLREADEPDPWGDWIEEREGILAFHTEIEEEYAESVLRQDLFDTAELFGQLRLNAKETESMDEYIVWQRNVNHWVKTGVYINASK